MISAPGRQVRPLHELHQLRGGGLGLLEQVDAGVGHLAQVVRRDVGGHADGDPRGAVQQQVGQARRQEHRLLERAVEVGGPVDGAVRELPEQHVGVLGELRLGVAHGGEGLRVILRAPVALPVDERVAVGEGLRHEHHRLVAGAVAVRVELAQHVAHGARGLLRLVDRRQPELAHRIGDAPLHRLQSVPQERQRAVEDHVHRVVEVGLLGEGAQRLPLDPLEVQLLVLRPRLDLHFREIALLLEPLTPVGGALLGRAACPSAGRCCPCPRWSAAPAGVCAGRWWSRAAARGSSRPGP